MHADSTKCLEGKRRGYMKTDESKGGWADDFVFVIKSTPFKINEDCRAQHETICRNLSFGFLYPIL